MFTVSEKRAHQSGEHRGGDRLDVELGGGAFDLDGDLVEAAMGELSDQAAELFRQRHVRPQLRRFLGAERRHVERIGDAAVDQVVGHLLGHLQRDIYLRLIGRGAEVRGADEIGGSEQRRLLGGFLDENVERRTGDMATVQRLFQRRLVDQSAARAIDDAHALLGLGEVFLRQDIAGLVGQRRVQRDKIRFCQQRIEIGLLHAHLDCAFLGEERIVGDDFHLQPQRPGCDDAADIARADQAERLAGHFDAHEIVLRPFARLGLLIGLGDLAGEGEDQGDGVLGGGDRIAERRVHHDNALRGSGGDIDIIDPDAGAANHLEPAGGSENFLGDFGRAADREAVVIADAGDQLFRGLAGDDIDLAAALFEDLRGVGVHLVGNEYAGLGHFLLPHLLIRDSPYLPGGVVRSD